MSAASSRSLTSRGVSPRSPPTVTAGCPGCASAASALAVSARTDAAAEREPARWAARRAVRGEGGAGHVAPVRGLDGVACEVDGLLGGGADVLGDALERRQALAAQALLDVRVLHRAGRGDRGLDGVLRQARGLGREFGVDRRPVVAGQRLGDGAGRGCSLL